MNTNEPAVAAVLAEYQDALNQSDTDAVMRLYASDGVFMPQHFPSSVGTDAVRKAYLGVRGNHADGGIQGCRSPTNSHRLGNRAHQFGRNSQGQRDRRRRRGGKSGALRVSEDQRRLENCALLLLYDESTKTLIIDAAADHRPPG